MEESENQIYFEKERIEVEREREKRRERESCMQRREGLRVTEEVGPRVKGSLQVLTNFVDGRGVCLICVEATTHY